MRKLFGIFTLTIATSTTAASLDQSLSTCRAIDDANQRLTCYDAIALGPQTHTNPQNETAAIPSETTSERFKALFGFEEKEIAKQIPDRIEVEVTEFSSNYGKAMIRLSNGQIWRQIDSKRFAYRADNGPAYIQRGAMGSFFFSQQDTNARIRVKRVK